MATETIKPALVPIARPNTPQWHELRKTGIGASEASAACSLSPYKTPLDLYLEKTGQIDPVEETDAMRLGTALEPVIQSEFEHRTGIKVIESPMGLYQSTENPFMLATPDADLETGDLGEWKSTTFRRAAELGEQETDDLPNDWVLQTQQQMYVMGRERVHVAVLLDGRTLRTYQVERNDRLIDGIIEAERELWERIENHDPPEPNWEHSRTPQLIRDLYDHVADGNRIDLSEAGSASWERAKQITQIIKELESEKNAERAKVLLEIGEHYAGVLPGGEKMVRRKMIEKKPYTVTPKPYVDCREVKFDGGVMHISIDAEELSFRFGKANNILRASGFGQHDKSEWGSVYYIHHKLPIRVRVSDHSPNRATRAWMENVDCVDLRIDRPDIKLKEEIDNLLKQETDNGDSNSTEKEHATDKTTAEV